MFREPVTFIAPTRMTDMRKHVARKFKRLEKMVGTSKRITWKMLNEFFDITHREWANQQSAVDQHTGGEEFVERWWYDYFVPRFNVLKDAKRAQGKRLAGR